MSKRKISKVNVTPQSTDFQCSHCLNPAELRCARCGSVKYCNRDCQEKNWNRHKIFCATIKKHQKNVKERSDYLDFNDVNLFKTDVGYFWDIPIARAYCISRKQLACTLYKCAQLNDSKLALELALEHMLDLIWLCRNDSVCLFLYIPNIYVMLRRVQDAYNFFKFWNALDGCDEHEHWEDGLFPFPLFFDRPFLSPKWTKRLESIEKADLYEGLCNLHLNLSTPAEETLSLFLVKYLALRHARKYEFNKANDSYQVFLSTLQHSDEPALRALQNCLPALDSIKTHVLGDSVDKINGLKLQLDCISALLNLQNHYILPLFLICPQIFRFTPESDFCRRGTLEEAYSLVSIVFYDWFQTPGSLCCLRKYYFKLFGKQKASSFIKEVTNFFKKLHSENE